MAEVLITLGIIGVVAAITLPALNLKTQKKEISKRLAKTYSTLSQAMQRSQAEHGDIVYWGFDSIYGSENTPNNRMEFVSSIVEKYFLPHLDIAKNYGYTSLKKAGLGDSYNYKNGNTYMSTSGLFYIIALKDSTILMFGINGNSESYTDPLIFVDINGSKKPNIVGRDLFLFEIKVKQNKFKTFQSGAYKRDILLEKCSKNGGDYDNLYCGALIEMDGWEIKDDYPW